MENLSINEEHIRKVIESTKMNIECAQKLVDELNSVKTDLFARYMDFHKLAIFNQMVPLIMGLANNLMIAGNNITHPFLQTKEAKEYGWDKQKLEQDPFFGQPDKADDSGANLEGILKTLLSE